MSKEMIIDTLQPLFEKAKREGLWFYSPSQDLWIAPEELEIEQKRGRLVWGAINWILKNPQERLNDFDYELSQLNYERNEFLKRVERYKISK